MERGFRFLKDKQFHVSDVYLKKERADRGSGHDHGALPSSLHAPGEDASRQTKTVERDDT